MNEDNWQIVSSVVGVFLVMGLGAFCRRRHWLTQAADRSLANLAANVLLPALFLDRVLEGDSLDSLSGAWQPPAFGFMLTAMGFLIAWLVARWCGRWIGLASDAQQRSFALCVGVCNYGYIPLPLAEIFYPTAQVELILHNVGVDMALWSVGFAIITGGTRSGKPGDGPPHRNRWRRILISPPLIAVLIGGTLTQTGWAEEIPPSLMNSIGWLSNCAIPMGLLLSGAIIVDFVGDVNWRGAWRTIVAAIAYRQLWMPILMLAAATEFAHTLDLRRVMMLEAAMPSAVFPIVLVRLFDKDTATAVRVVVATSLAGIVLIPTWLAIGRWWLGLS